MNDVIESSQDKSLADLAREALWFCLHTLFALLLLALTLGVMTFAQPDPDSPGPKLLGTALALIVPLAGGFAIARIQRSPVARYVWIAGLMVFFFVCVWVLDLPTGNGLCDGCGAVEKLSRTFFRIDHGSGLMSGDGLLAGTWVPLSIVAYSLGAWLAHRRAASPR